MALGGARPGSGRKKGFKFPHSLEANAAKQYIIKRVTEELAPMLDAQIKIAKKHGERSGRSSVSSFKELTERAFGKVATIIGNEEGLPFVIEISNSIAKKNGIDRATNPNS